jgi:hypothetical protein
MLRKFCSAGVVILACMASVASHAQTILEPTSLNSVVYLDTASEKIVPLEVQTGAVVKKARAFGFGGASVTGSVPGNTSSIQLPSGQSHIFAVRLVQGVDPSKYTLYKMEPTGGSREVMLSNAYVVGAEGGMGTVRYETQQLGASSYKLVIAPNLPPGEYGFTAKDSPNVFLFALK